MAFPVSPTDGQTFTENNTVWIYSAVMGQWNRSVINPLNETLYEFGGSATATGNAGEIQYTDGTNLAASPNLLWDNANNELEVGGDVVLDDGGTYTTTLQTITPTAARTISFPDATGTVGLVGGSSGNLVVNQSGAYAGVANSSVDNATGNITLGSRFISSLNGAASAPPGTFTGTWFTGGTATTTKPQVLIEPTGTTSTAWSTSGTGLGVNAASGFAGNLLDLQLNGTSRAIVTGAGLVGIGTSSPNSRLVVKSSASSTTVFRCNAADDINIFQVYESPTGDGEVYIKNTAGAPKIALLANGSSYIIGGSLGLGTTTPSSLLHLGDAGDITVGTTTGTKIGTATTQKLGFFDKTPVVQPLAVADATDATNAITQFNTLLARMRDLGLIAT
jgi:hypothetical protein